jgi:HlyD family secretion protein
MNRYMKYSVWLIVPFILVALLTEGVFFFGNETTLSSYRTDIITRGSIAEVIAASGTLSPVQEVTVGTQVSGRVSNVYVAVNDQVKRGQLLAEIDPSLLIAQVEQSRSNLQTARINFQQAERDLKRTQMLLEKDYVAQIDLEHAQQSLIVAKNAFDSAKTQVSRDEVNLNYAKIVSPIDGVVVSQDMKLGETVAANFQTPNLFKIAGDLTQMKIDVKLSESDISKVKMDMPVTFTVDAFPGREFAGKMQMINLSPDAQQGVVTYTVVVAAENKDKSLLPGMTAYVSIVLSEQNDVLRVPASALRFTPPQEQVSGFQRLLHSSITTKANVPTPGNDNEGKHVIYLLRDSIAIPVAVTVGAADDSNVEISGEGVAEGDIVILGLNHTQRR